MTAAVREMRSLASQGLRGCNMRAARRRVVYYTQTPRLTVLRQPLARRYQSTVSTTTSTQQPLSSEINTAATTTTTQAPIGSATTSPGKQPSRLVRAATTAGLFIVCLVAGFTMAAAPAVEAVNGFVNPPTDAESLTLFKPSTPHSAEVDEHIKSHPLSVKLRSEGLTESRPHLRLPPGIREHNLSYAVLMGEGKIEVPPLVFQDKTSELPSIYSLSYLGPSLSGHPGMVHGGLLATMLDEGLARACFPALPNKVGVTASLKINYLAPCPAESYVVLKAYTTKVEGRKAWVKGWIELLGEDDKEGTKVAEAEALFIEPRQAKSMARIYSGE